MEGFGHVKEVFGTRNIYNLTPDESATSFDLTLEFASPTRIVATAPTPDGLMRAEVTGQFSYAEPLTAEGLQSIQGTISTYQQEIGGLLTERESYPEGTSVAGWNLGQPSYAFEMSLLSGNDYFAGSPLRHENARDGMRGGDGNDTFVGYSGSDYFFGEGDIDTAVYRGKLSEYKIETSSDIRDDRLNDGTRVSGYIVTDSVEGRDDVDELVEVERLQFSDVTLALDIDGIAAEAYRIYKAAFDRQPDLTGLGFWIKNMDAGMGLEAVAQEFINSAEFIRMYGPNPTDEQFVDLLYANVLDRQADQSGYDFWIGALDRGLTRAGLLAEFSESRENVANVAPLIEDGIQYTAFVG